MNDHAETATEGAEAFGGPVTVATPGLVVGI